MNDLDGRLFIAYYIKFNSFTELYKELPLEKCEYSEKELKNADPADMNAYYSVEEQSKYGVIGIEVEVIRN